MTVEKSCDIVLAYLSKYPQNTYSIENILNKNNIPIELKGKCLSLLMTKNFIKASPTKKETFIQITPEGVVFSLHSSFEEEKKMSNKKTSSQRTARIFTISYKILSALGIIAAIWFGFSNNEKKNELKELKKQNQSLQFKIDSLLKK